MEIFILIAVIIGAVATVDIKTSKKEENIKENA